MTSFPFVQGLEYTVHLERFCDFQHQCSMWHVLIYQWEVAGNNWKFNALILLKQLFHIYKYKGEKCHGLLLYNIMNQQER